MEQKKFEEFMEVIRQLRGENGCPWDRAQTHESLINCVREEAYEVIWAIEQKDMENLKEELGDLLLQVALHSVIAEEQKAFTIEDVIDRVKEKMIYRHPHVFGGEGAKKEEEALQNWEQRKQKEHKEETIGQSMKQIPKVLPANLRAEKVQKKAAKAGFDFESYEQVLCKVYEELKELEEARAIGDSAKIQEEFGDIMFSLINLSRFLQLNAENSLTNATNKFINRFVGIECIVENEGYDLKHMSIEEIETLWGRIKESEKSGLIPNNVD